MKLSSGRKQWLGELAEKYHTAGMENEALLAYLADRGIETSLAEEYRLGLVSEPDPAHIQYEGRLAIPYLTPTGVVSLRFRCIEHHEGYEGCQDFEKKSGTWHKKYLQPDGTDDHLYNVPAFRERHPAIAVCEGEIDTITIDTHVLPAVGVPGATKWKKHWSRLLEGYERVLVCGDGDDSGREFTARLVEMLPNAKAVVFPDGLDANAFFLQEGAEALEQFVLG